MRPATSGANPRTEGAEEYRVYVAGYYAWTYLNEDLSREQAEARMDDLLALERVA